MSINGTLIWYYTICKREVWLIGHGIEADQNFDAIELGRIIHQISYKNAKKEILIDGLKIDILENRQIIGEIKSSSKFLKSAKMQLYYYLYRLKKLGINMDGELLIPKERKRVKLHLTKEIEEILIVMEMEIEKILVSPKPPPAKKIWYCKSCAYKELCWS